MPVRRLLYNAAFAVLLASPTLALAAACPVPHSTFGSSGTANGEFNRPFGISADPGGLLYVTDQQNERVQVFDANGNFVRTWPVPVDPVRGYAYPTGICVSNGIVWVSANQGHYVGRWTTSGTFLGYVTNPFGGWYYPTDIAADADGQIYIATSNYGQIVRVDPVSLNVVTLWNTNGTPYGLHVDALGTVCVGDIGNHVVSRWTRDGVWLAQLSTPLPFFAPEGIASDGAGNLYVCDTGNRRVQKFAMNGSWLCTFGFEGSGLGELFVPSDLCVAPNGDLYVVEYGNNRVQRFTFGAVASKPASWGRLKTLYR